MLIHERIKARRKELGLSADKVAEALGVSRATIYRYESSEIEKVSINALIPLSKVLKCSPSYLMGWDDELNEPEVEPKAEIKTIAAHTIEDLNEEQLKRVVEFAKFIKSQDEK